MTAEHRAQKKAVAARFGENLRRYRKRADLSQESLGYVTSLHRTEIGLLERGERMPRIDTLIKVASGLGLEPDQLLEGITWNSGEVTEGTFRLREEE